MRKQTKYRKKHPNTPSQIKLDSGYVNNQGHYYPTKQEAVVTSFIHFLIGNLRNGFPVHVKHFWYPAKALYPFLLLRKEGWSKETILHEMIHIHQQRETLVFFGYIWYSMEFIIRLSITGSVRKAYETHSMEKEARAFQHDEGYLKRRKRFAFINYL